MATTWTGIVEREIDCQPGHYYVTARDERGRTAFLLGPYTQRKIGGFGHVRARSRINLARRILRDMGHPQEPWLLYGTSRLPITKSRPPIGKLNEVAALREP